MSNNFKDRPRGTSTKGSNTKMPSSLEYEDRYQEDVDKQKSGNYDSLKNLKSALRQKLPNIANYEQRNMKKNISKLQKQVQTKEIQSSLQKVPPFIPNYSQGDSSTAKKSLKRQASSSYKKKQEFKEIQSQKQSMLEFAKQQQMLTQKSIQDYLLQNNENKFKFKKFEVPSLELKAEDDDYSQCNYYQRYITPQLTFKFSHNEVKLVKEVLESNGVKDLSSQNNNEENGFSNEDQANLIWSTCMIKSNIYQSLAKHQKVNHFPRSYEITRKDLFHQRMAKMMVLHGHKNFDFIPKTFQIPQDLMKFQSEVQKKKDQFWIFKPVASSQGKGIFVTRKLEDIPPKQNFIASQYIKNPLLINGFKFDLRIYVAITSVNPLRLYVYEEGLTRFATEKYNNEDHKNVFVHLTNYSINKKNSQKFQANEDGDKENVGSKWSLTALKSYLEGLIQSMKNPPPSCNVNLLFEKINSMIIKTIISVEPLLQNGLEMYLKSRNFNCFEILGFDVLIDELFNPWLLEVNLSPSLNTDSPLDYKIKCNMMVDLFNLVGFSTENQNSHSQMHKRNKSRSGKAGSKFTGGTYSSSDRGILKKNFLPKIFNQQENFMSSYSNEEYDTILEAVQEFDRKGKFQRLFPNENYPYYRQFFEEERSKDKLLYQFFYQNKLRAQSLEQISKQNIPQYSSQSTYRLKKHLDKLMKEGGKKDQKQEQQEKNKQQISKKRRLDDISGGVEQQEKATKKRRVASQKRYTEDSFGASHILQEQERKRNDDEESIQMRFQKTQQISKRQDRQLEWLLSFSMNKNDKRWLENFFDNTIKRTEQSLQEKYITSRNLLRVDKRIKNKSGDLLEEFDQFFTAIFPKYIYVALAQMQQEQQRQGILNKFDLKEYLDILPFSVNQNQENFDQFKNFVKTDMPIEMNKYIKGQCILELVKDQSQKKQLELWIKNNLIKKDEIILDKIVGKLEAQQSQWDSQEQSFYEKESQRLWEFIVNQLPEVLEKLQKGSLYQSKRRVQEQEESKKPQRVESKRRSKDRLLRQVSSEEQEELPQIKGISEAERERKAKERYELKLIKEKTAKEMEKKEREEKEKQQQMVPSQNIYLDSPMKEQVERIMSKKRPKGEILTQEEEYILKQKEKFVGIDFEKQNKKKANAQFVSHIIKEFHHDEKDEEGVSEDEYQAEMINEEQQRNFVEKGGKIDYKSGEIYPESSSSEDENGVPKQFISRRFQKVYTEPAKEINIKKKKNTNKLTSGSNPFNAQLHEFLLNEAIQAPMFLPLEREDVDPSNDVLQAAIENPNIPISELIRKENFYNSFNLFHKAIKADPALIKTEIQRKMKFYDQFFGVRRTTAEQKEYERFTQGDFRRFCSIFYFKTRKLLKCTEFLMSRENKKRMQPRHLLTAAVLSGVIPMSKITNEKLTEEEQRDIEEALNQRKQKRTPLQARPSQNAQATTQGVNQPRGRGRPRKNATSLNPPKNRQ